MPDSVSRPPSAVATEAIVRGGRPRGGAGDPDPREPVGAGQAGVPGESRRLLVDPQLPPALLVQTHKSTATRLRAMRVRVRLFAGLRERAGTAERELGLGDTATV